MRVFLQLSHPSIPYGGLRQETCFMMHIHLLLIHSYSLNFKCCVISEVIRCKMEQNLTGFTILLPTGMENGYA